MRVDDKRRYRRGFSLLELITVCLVLLILLGIGVIAVRAAVVNYKLDGLDSSARIIYVAAQNGVSAAKQTGSDKLDTLAIPRRSFDEYPNGCYEISSADTEALDIILPQTGIDAVLRAGNYIIILDRATHAVLEVYYREGAEVNSSLLDEYRLEMSGKEARRRDLVGYYGGGGNEMPVIVALDAPTGIEMVDDEVMNRLTALVTLADAGFSRTLNIYVNGYRIAVCDIAPGETEAAVTIDSLEDGGHFEELTGGKIVPGSDVTITATVTKSAEAVINGSDVEYHIYQDSPPAVAACNSLFAARIGDTVTIANARHLQNLAAPVSGASGITAAVLTKNISLDSISEFVPIVPCPSLNTFDGDDFRISGLHVDTMGAAGLFSSFGSDSSSVIRDVTIVSPYINGSNCGALAESVTGSIIGCQVIDPAVIGSGICGCLAGTVGGSIEDCLVGETPAGAPAVCTVSGRTAGGLAGAVSGSVNGCRVSIAGVYGVDAAGGIAGSCAGTIENSYANISGSQTDAGIKVGDAGKAGGIVGDGAGCAVTNCYAFASFNAGNGTAGGIGGGLLLAENCYALFYACDNSGAVYAVSPTGGTSNCFYSSANASIADGGAPAIESTLDKFGDFAALPLPATGFMKLSSYDTICYSADYAGMTFPYFALTAIGKHLGDWPVNTVSRAVPVYYEVYRRPNYSGGTLSYDNFYVFYARDGAYSINTVSGGTGADGKLLPRYKDGYGILFGTDTDVNSSLSVTYETTSGSVTSSLVTPEAAGIEPTLRLTDAAGNEKLYKIALLPDAAVQTDLNSENVTYTVGEKTLTINPRFSPLSSGDATPVRTVRHLYNLGRFSSLYGSRNFVQQADLDYSEYVGYRADVIPRPVTQPTALSFSGVYDGAGYKITGLNPGTVATATYGGIFGCLTGTVKNLTVIPRAGASASVGGTGGVAGIIAALNEGRIENCSVSVTAGTFSFAAGQAVGLVAGRNSGIIKNCDVVLGENVTLSAADAAGGLVGTNSGTIEDCLVAEREGAADNAMLKVNGGGAAGGLAGRNSATLLRCAAAFNELSGGGSVGGLVGSSSGMAENCYANLRRVRTTGGAGVNAGGLIGGGSGRAVACYAFSSIVVGTGADAGGFAGAAGTFEKCYCAFYEGSSVSAVYPFAPSGNATDCAYTTSNISIRTGSTVGTQKSMAALINTYSSMSEFYRPDVETTHSYNPDFAGKACPFPALTALGGHYGDWPQDELALFAVYYEVYRTSSISTSGQISYVDNYVFYAADSVGRVFDNINESADIPRSSDGYAVISRSDLTGKTVIYPTGETTTASAPLRINNDYPTLTLGSGDDAMVYSLYFMDDAVVQSSYASASMTQSYNIEGQTLRFYPHFATTSSASTGTAVVRTARHLYNLGRFNTVYGGGNFIQELDVDYAIYTAYGISGQPTVASFAGSYDGGGKKLKNVTPGTAGSLGGVFGAVSGTVVNVNIETAPGVNGSSGGYMSVLAANNSGLIRNCTVTVADGSLYISGRNGSGLIAGNSTGSVSECGAYIKNATELSGADAGVFVGVNSGEIDRCEVVLDTVSVNVSGTSHSGGLVGLNTSGGLISNSTVCTEAGSPTEVTLGGGASTGGFAGGNSGEINDCSVTTRGVKSLHIVGASPAGFVGNNTSSVTSCYIRADGTVNDYNIFVAGTTNASGFADINSGTVEKCCAVGYVNASSGRASGFAGRNSSYITESYANCYTTGRTAAGFVGDNRGNAYRCYSMIRVVGETRAAGFALSNSGSLSSCYVTAVTIADDNDDAYGFAPSSGKISKDCVYLGADVFTQNGGGRALFYDEMETECSFGGGGYAAYPYSFTVAEAGSFPFSMNQDHYGDWPQETVECVGLFYYERYADGTYGVFTCGRCTDSDDTMPRFAGLRQDTIVKTGYGVFFTKTENSLFETFRFTSDNGQRNTKLETLRVTYENINIDPAYYFIDCTTKTNGTQSTTVFGAGEATVTLTRPGNMFAFSTFEVNTHFAKQINNEGKTWGRVSDPDYPFWVRTADQLENANNSEYLGVNDKFYYKQDHNIDLSSTPNLMIGTSYANCFNSIYDGCDYYIDNWSLEGTFNSSSLGLFAYVYSSGQISNLFIRGNIDVTLPSSDSYKDVGFIGYCYGRLTNVYSYGTINVEKDWGTVYAYAGGLVGRLSGYAVNCGSDVDVTMATNINVCAVGGFVGYYAGSGGSYNGVTMSGAHLSFCYSLGDVTGPAYTDNKYIAGFAGRDSGYTSCYIYHCYSAGETVYANSNTTTITTFGGLISGAHYFTYAYNGGVCRGGTLRYGNIYSYVSGAQSSWPCYACFIKHVKNSNYVARRINNMSEPLYYIHQPTSFVYSNKYGSDGDYQIVAVRGQEEAMLYSFFPLPLNADGTYSFVNDVGATYHVPVTISGEWVMKTSYKYGVSLPQLSQNPERNPVSVFQTQ